MLNKFEALGIGLSIIIMAVALFLLRVESMGGNQLLEQPTQPATAIVPQGDTRDDARLETIRDSVDERGRVERLIVDDIVIGTGPAVAVGDTVTVHYVGTLQSGQEFDNSQKRGQPFTFTVGRNQVIEGWETGLIGMQVGGQRILVVPPELGYGSSQVGPIPANTTLVFAIELLSIE